MEGTLPSTSNRQAATMVLFSSCCMNFRPPRLPILALFSDRFFWVTQRGLVSLLFIKPMHCCCWALTHLLWKHTCFLFLWSWTGFVMAFSRCDHQCGFIHLLTHVPAHSGPQPSQCSFSHSLLCVICNCAWEPTLSLSFLPSQLAFWFSPSQKT